MADYKRWWTSNPFSEFHRINLPGYCCLFDVDAVFLSGSGDLFGLYEGKYKMDRIERGNFIDTFYEDNNIQSGFLRTISEKIPIWVHEEITNKWWDIEGEKLIECSIPRLDLRKTNDRIYIGYMMGYKGKKGRVYSIFHRTLGKRPPDDNGISDKLSDIFQCKKILVNDTHKKDHIYFKCVDADKIIETSLLEENDWKKYWKEMGIL